MARPAHDSSGPIDYSIKLKPDNSQRQGDSVIHYLPSGRSNIDLNRLKPASSIQDSKTCGPLDSGRKRKFDNNGHGADNATYLPPKHLYIKSESVNRLHLGGARCHDVNKSPEPPGLSGTLQQIFDTVSKSECPRTPFSSVTDSPTVEYFRKASSLTRSNSPEQGSSGGEQVKVNKLKELLSGKKSCNCNINVEVPA